MVNPLCTNEALCLFKRLTVEFPLGSVWLQSFVKSLSGVLYCCVDRNIFPGSLSVSPDTAVPMKLMMCKSPSWVNCPAHAGGMGFMGTLVMFPSSGLSVPIVWSLTWWTDCSPLRPLPQAMEGQVEVASSLRSAHPSEMSFSWPLAFPRPVSSSPSIYQKGGPWL